MRIDKCPDCGEHVNINSDHTPGCVHRQHLIDGLHAIRDAGKKSDNGLEVLKSAASGVMLNPDCRDGKHASCSGDGWDISADEQAPCPCTCHVRTR